MGPSQTCSALRWAGIRPRQACDDARSAAACNGRKDRNVPIVCNEEALQDPTSECFNGELSNDTFHPNVFGGEATVGWSLGGGRVQPFLGGGMNFLRPRFRVNFTNAVGSTDRRRVEVDLTRAILFGGATWFPLPRLGITGQIYSAPSDAVTGRLTVSYGAGGR